MQEATRRQYLALLGIEQWVPRDAVDEVPADVPAAAGRDAVSAAATALPAAAGEPSVIAGDAPATGTAPAGQAHPDPVRPPVPAATPRPAAPVVEAASPTAPPAVAPSAPAERIGCSFLALADGLLVVAAFAAPEAPGLTGPEHEMLVRLGQALVPGRSVGAVTDFHWPPRGVRVPGLDRPGEAARAFAALLAGPALAGTRDVLLLGESLAGVLAPSGVNVVAAPALSAMLADPAAKRACWELAKPLLRAAP